MKKLTLLYLLLCAYQASAASHAFEGFSATLAGGGLILNADTQQKPQAGNPSSIEVDMDVETNVTASSGTGYLGVGYGFQFSHVWFLGFGLTAGLSHAESTYLQEAYFGGSLFSGEVETLLENDFALLIKPGYVVHEHTLIYGLLGPRWGNFKDTVTGSLDISDLDLFTDSQSQQEYRLGITAGAGIVHAFAKHWNVGLEYAYTSYGSWNAPSTLTSFPSVPPSTVTNNAEVSVSTHAVVAQLSYLF